MCGGRWRRHFINIPELSSAELPVTEDSSLVNNFRTIGPVSPEKQTHVMLILASPEILCRLWNHVGKQLNLHPADILE